MLIDGDAYNLRLWPEPKTEWAVTWGKNADGFPFGTDRGAAQDVYEGRVHVAGPLATLNALQATLEGCRAGVTLSGFNSGEMPFGADVDYSGSIEAAVLNFGIRKNIMLGLVDELFIDFRAIAPDLLDTEPSLATLKLQPGWTGDRSTDARAQFSYTGAATFLDHATDAGTFAGHFIQTTDQMKAIRAYLLTVARATPFQFPALFPNPFNPFGANASDDRFQKCVVLDWSDRRRSLNRWDLEITFGQALPYFSAGEDAADDVADLVLLTPGDSGDETDFLGTPGG